MVGCLHLHRICTSSSPHPQYTLTTSAQPQAHQNYLERRQHWVPHGPSCSRQGVSLIVQITLYSMRWGRWASNWGGGG